MESVAVGWNATVQVGKHHDDDDESTGGGSSSSCTIVETVRVPDSEAVVIFGEQYITLQVRVLQVVTVLSNDSTFTQEDVTTMIEAGFVHSTGGEQTFRGILHEHGSFRTVLKIQVLDDLLDVTEAPTPSPPPPTPPPRTPSPSKSPTKSPITLAATRSPTKHPTLVPTKLPTTKPPTHIPTMTPSRRPSNYPSMMPSEKETTFYPSTLPTMSPTSRPPTVRHPRVDSVYSTTTSSSSISTQKSEEHATHDDSFSISNWLEDMDSLALAALAGGAAILVASCLLVCCVWRRRKSYLKHKQLPREKGGPLAPQMASCFVPGFVELDADLQSLANTSLGELTAGRRPTSSKKLQPQQRPEMARQLRPDDSFDESSLYTTPFSLRLDETSSYYPTSSTTTPSYLSRNLIGPISYSDSILYPMMSDATSETSDGLYSSGALSGIGPFSVDEGPIDVDTQEPYVMESARLRITAISNGPIDLDTEECYVNDGDTGVEIESQPDEVKAQKISQAMETGQLDFNQMDEWSNSGYEEFESASDFYVEPVRSSSHSYSSKTTAKMENGGRHSFVIRAPEESETSSEGSEEEKQEVSDRDNFDGGRTKFLASKFLNKSDNNPTKTFLPKGLLTNKQSFESPRSPVSYSSQNSASSRRSPSSVSSRASSKTLVEQSPIHTKSETRKAKHFEREDTDLFQSPAQIRSSPHTKTTEDHEEKSTPPQHSHFIPVVTPEGNEDEASDMDGSSAATSDAQQSTQEDDDTSASSAATGMSPSPWLFHTVEETLGPRSVTADIESLEGKPLRSTHSRSRSSLSGAESVASGASSQLSYSSSLARSSVVSSSPRDLEHDLRRLELQLAVLDSDQVTTSSVTVPSMAANSLATAISRNILRNRPPKIQGTKRFDVTAPSGRLGVILANHHDGKGTIISEVRDHSALKGMLFPGDKLVAVDGEDVTGMLVSQITSLMAAKAGSERRLTIDTKTPID